MRSIATLGLLLALLLTSACGDPAEEVRERLYGDWQIDLSAVAGSVPEAAPPEIHAYATMLVEDFSMHFSLQPEGRLTMVRTIRGRDTTRNGTWELLAWEGDTMVIRTTFGSDTDDLRVGLAGSRLVVQDGPQTMLFRRR